MTTLFDGLFDDAALFPPGTPRWPSPFPRIGSSASALGDWSARSWCRPAGWTN